MPTSPRRNAFIFTEILGEFDSTQWGEWASAPTHSPEDLKNSGRPFVWGLPLCYPSINFEVPGTG